MPRHMMVTVNQWARRLHAKDDDRNMISAGFHMITITLICMSMVDLTWFNISGGVCTPNLSLGNFFTFGYKSERLGTESRCITPLIVNMMRITILLCFMALIFTLADFLLDLTSPKYFLYRVLRRYAVLGVCTILWILTIISVSYYIILLLEDSMEVNKIDASVSYGAGFFLLATAGGVCLVGIFYNLVLANHPPSCPPGGDDRCLIDVSDEGLDTFNSPTPPPPYNQPPPPYTP